MFAQESVMDIEKEREAFEKHASKFFKTNEAFEDDGENYVYDEVKFMWDCWLAAKAHEAEKLKGCVLVPVQCPDPDFADSLFDELNIISVHYNIKKLVKEPSHISHIHIRRD